MSICRNTEDIDVILEYTHSKDNDVRLEAVKQLCPCKVQRDIEVFWDRVFELVGDEDERIRKRILHIICDGSPERLEDRIYDALMEFNRDKDSDIRRTAHKVLASFEHTGKWNILWDWMIMIFFDLISIKDFKSKLTTISTHPTPF